MSTALVSNSRNIMKMKVGCSCPFAISKRHFQNIPKPQTYNDIIWPKDGATKLPFMAKEPPGIHMPGVGLVQLKQTNKVIESRFPEIVHTELMYKQYGIVAIRGGLLWIENFNTICNVVNHHMNKDRFAVWRVEAPWLPKSRRSDGTKKGGGKSKIKFYCTPVRSGRIVLEVGGKLSEDETQEFLATVADRIPFECKFVTYERMLAEQEAEEKLLRENVNKFDWDTVLKWNMQNVSMQVSKYDFYYKGKVI